MPVVCAGALVAPGDAIVADDDGVVVCPRARVARKWRKPRPRAKPTKDAKRERLAAGTLGLDMYAMREPLAAPGCAMSTEATQTAVPPARWRIGLVGYGEVGRILAEELRSRDHVVRAWDLKLGHEHRPGRCRNTPPRTASSSPARVPRAAAGAELVISAVTASQTVAAAQAACPGLAPGAFFLDFNSASPGAKAEAARLVEGAGGRYVEGAVMTSISPQRLRVPLLLGGPKRRDLDAPLNAIGFAARVASEKLGVASATKMCRSVMIKGLEAMVIEKLHGRPPLRRRRRARSLRCSETLPGMDWERPGGG